MFCMLLRKYIEGAKIKLIKAPEHERIFEIYVDSYNEIGERIELVLAVELMGKHSNIILYRSDDNSIIGCAHNIGSEKSRIRELSGGLPYVYPEKPNKKNLLQTSKEEFYQDLKLLHQPIFWELNQSYHDISIALSKELCSTAGITTDFEKISATETKKILALYDVARDVLSLKNLNPSISGDRQNYSLFSLDKTQNQTFYPDVNTMIDEYFAHFIHEDNFNILKNQLLGVLNKNLKNRQKELEKIQPEKSDFQKAERYKQIGDILAANTFAIDYPRENVELENFYDNNEKISITLDTSLSLNENIQRYYKLHSKAKTAIAMNLKRKELIDADLAYFKEVLSAINQAEKISTLAEIKEEMISQNLINEARPPQKQKQKSVIEIENIDFEGYTIYVGKNNKQNDYIVSKISQADDIWLHAQNIPGSHVLIKVPNNNPEIPDSVLLKGAQLAAYYSQGRESTKTDVIFTRRKFLKKPPGAKPGYVTYSNEKTIIVD